MAETKTPFDALKEEYVSLRSEIAQSISFQHRILLAGYGASGAIVGILASTSHLSWIGLLVVPFVFSAMIALWTVECNRMVRASYYIGEILWPEICRQVGLANAPDWERWIRKTDGLAGKFGLIQDRQQQIAVWVVPAVISALCAGSALWDSMETGKGSLIAGSFAVFAQLLLWMWLVYQVQFASRLSKSPLTPLPLEERAS